MLAKLGFEQKAIVISCDSSSVLHLYKSPQHHEKIKHIDIKLHLIRNEVLKRGYQSGWSSKW